MLTSRNTVSPLKIMVVDFDNLTKDYIIHVTVCIEGRPETILVQGFFCSVAIDRENFSFLADRSNWKPSSDMPSVNQTEV